MSCPINDIRNFKAERNEKATDNVVNIKREAPIAAMHFARADEAESIEVTIMNENKETITCEEVNMKDINVNATVETNDAVEAEQVETVSMVDVEKRVRAIKGKNAFMNVASGIGAAFVVAATAKKYGRSERGAAIAAGIVASLSIANTFSARQAEETKRFAETASEEEFNAAKRISIMDDVLPTFVGTVVVGALIGRFLVKKAAVTDEV